jgi:hypothetical protein
LVSSMNIGSTLFWSVLRGNSLTADGAVPFDPGIEGLGSSLESKTASWAPFVHLEAVQEFILVMIMFAYFGVCHVSCVCYV